MPAPVPSFERRSPSELWAQFQREKAWAARLRNAPAGERGTLYREIYQSFGAEPLAAVDQALALQLQLLEPHLTPDTVVLEWGAAQGALSRRLAARVQRVFAVDVVDPPATLPANLEWLDGAAFRTPLPDGSIDLLYSCHVVEHLHPDDLRQLLREARRLLVPGGRCVLVTPHRLYGPHDVSKYFVDGEAAGLHLKEYSYAELAALLRGAGFATVGALSQRGVPRPVWPRILAERAGARSALLRRMVSRCGAPPLRPLEQIKLLARR